MPDATGPQEGKACLYFRNAGQFAAVESDPFPTPATGQLAMTVFARGENLRRTPSCGSCSKPKKMARIIASP